jgi:hypothetical protein
LDENKKENETKKNIVQDSIQPSDTEIGVRKNDLTLGVWWEKRKDRH